MLDLYDLASYYVFNRRELPRPKPEEKLMKPKIDTDIIKLFTVLILGSFCISIVFAFIALLPALLIELLFGK